MNTCRRPFLWDEGAERRDESEIAIFVRTSRKTTSYEAENASAHVHKPLCMHMIT